MNRFSLNDLWMMYKTRGFILPIKYLLECWWFDLSRGVSTHHRMQTNEFLEDKIQKKHSVLYMSSWTSVIKSSTKFAISYLREYETRKPILVDVGSGKGKVLLAWCENRKISSEVYKIYGIELSSLLFQVCESNLKNFKRKLIEPCNLCEDILDSEITFKNSPYIFYLYNPFDAVIMKKFLKKLSQDFIDGQNFILIYNNPVHHSTILESGLHLIHKFNYWHPNGVVNFYSSKEQS